MSGLDLVTKIFGVGGVSTIEKALAAKGIKFAEYALPEALAGALGKFDRQTEGLSASLIDTGRYLGFQCKYEGFPKRMSPLKPCFELSNRGEPMMPTLDQIVKKLTSMLSLAASCSNPKAVAVVEKTSQDASKLAMAA